NALRVSGSGPVGCRGASVAGGARALAAHVDLLAHAGDDLAVAIDDVGLEPVQASGAAGGGVADAAEGVVAEVEFRGHGAAAGLDELELRRLVPDVVALAQC